MVKKKRIKSKSKNVRKVVEKNIAKGSGRHLKNKIKKSFKKAHVKKKVAKKVHKIRRGVHRALRKKHRVQRARKIENKNKREIVARIATGVPNFDRLIGKGFEKNTTNLLVGGSGSGKTIFATQFLIEGIKNGEKCLYVTFEEKKEQFYLNMKEFGWDLGEYEKKGAFTFLEYTPMKVKTMLEEGGGAIESVILKNKISRLVIDSITSFELLFDDELEKREAALALFGMIRDWDATALLTLEEEPSAQEKISSRTLEFESDSIVVLYYIREDKKAERERYLEIIKMRGTEHSNKVYPFDITKKGIFVKKSAVSHFVTG